MEPARDHGKPRRRNQRPTETGRRAVVPSGIVARSPADHHVHMEPPNRVARQSDVAIRGGLLAAICVGLGACGVGASDQPREASVVLSCANAPMSVTFVDFTLRAVNTGSQTCSLSGHHRVEVPWWRILGAGPSAVEGNLPPGAALVQAYTFEGGNGCPWPGGEGDATIGVSVEGKAHLLTHYAAHGSSDRAVSDPFGGDLEVYRATYEELEKEIKRVFDRIAAEQTPGPS